MNPTEVEKVVGQISEKDVMVSKTRTELGEELSADQSVLQDFARRKLWDQDVAISAVGSIEGLLDYNRIRNDMSRNA